MSYSQEELDVLFGTVDNEIKTIQMKQGFIRQEMLDVRNTGGKFVEAKTHLLGTIRNRCNKLAILQLINIGAVVLAFIATMIAVGTLFTKVDKMAHDYDYLVNLKNMERGIK